MEFVTAQYEGEYYYKIYNAYKANLKPKSRILQDNLWQCIQSILKTRDELKQFNILSIGSGDGSRDIEVLEIVHQELQKEPKFQNTTIFLRAVEPNQYYNQLYKQAVAKLPDSLKNKSTIDHRQNTFQEYTKDHDEMQFDMIMFLQSIYYCDTEESVSFATSNILKENGRLVVNLDVRGLIYDVLPLVFPENVLHPPKNYKVFEGDPYEKLLKTLIKNNLKYTEFGETLSLDVTEVIDDISEDGKLLLDFLTQLKDFRTKANPEQLESVLSVIREKTVAKDGRYFGDLKHVLLVILKM